MSRKLNPVAAFTLIETLIAMSVLVSGGLAAAQLFAFSVATIVRAEQASRAAWAVAEKADELRRLPPSGLAPGGTLDPRSPAAGYYEYLGVTPTGALIRSGRADASMLRLWTIDTAGPVRLRVAVFAMNQRSGAPGLLLAHLTSTF